MSNTLYLPDADAYRRIVPQLLRNIRGGVQDTRCRLWTLIAASGDQVAKQRELAPLRAGQ